jgi:hypothetical protein
MYAMYTYRYASLDDGDAFCEMRRWAIWSSRELALTQTLVVQHSLLHTSSIWYSLLLLGYKPVRHVTILNTVRNCNTMLSIITQC